MSTSTAVTRGVFAVAVAVLVHGGLALVPVPKSAKKTPPRPVPLRLMAALMAPPKVSEVQTAPAPAPAKAIERPRPKPTRRRRPKPATVKATASANLGTQPTPAEEAPKSVPAAPPPSAAESSARDPRADLNVARGPKPTTTPEPSSPEAAPAPTVDFGPYRRALVHAVTREKRYPRQARRRRQQGLVQLRVVIDAEGELVEPIRVTKSSGYAALDAEARRMVEAAAPFGAWPGPRETPTLVVVVPVRFSLSSAR